MEQPFHHGFCMMLFLFSFLPPSPAAPVSGSARSGLRNRRLGFDPIALNNAEAFAGSLDNIWTDILSLGTVDDIVGDQPKLKVERGDEEATSDAYMNDINSFLSSVSGILEVQRNVIEATYGLKTESTNDPCILPNLATESDYPSDLHYSAEHAESISTQACIIKTPSSSATLSEDFASWAPKLMDVVSDDPDVLWQYFGDASSGNAFLYPAFHWPGYDWDPRARPWYTTAASGPKDSIIILDITRYENFAHASEIVSTFLSRLSGEDYVNIVAKNQFIVRSNCFEGKLARATPDNVSEIKRFLAEVGVLVYSDLGNAFSEAIDMAIATRNQDAGTGCELNVILVTDRNEIAPSDLKIMENAISKRAQTVAVTEDSPTGLHLFNVHVGEESSTLSSSILASLKCLALGISVRTAPSGGTAAVNTVLFAIFDYFGNSLNAGQMQQVKWSQPYDDASGSGLIVTATINCFVDGVFIGIMAADVGLGYLSSVVSSARVGSSYGSLINTNGEVIVHPMLDASSAIGTGEVFSYDIGDYEPYDEFASKVRPKIHRTAYGFSEVEVTRVRPSGDLEKEGSYTVDSKLMYVWRHLRGTPFILVFVYDEEDKLRHDFAIGASDHSSTLVYHNLQLFPPELATELNITDGLSHTKGSYKFSPSAFVDEGTYLTDTESWDGGAQNLNDLVDPSVFHAGEVMIAEIEAMSNVMGLSLQTIVPDYILARYCGSIHGTLYLLPGQYIAHPPYDPRLRPWYTRAIANNLRTLSVSTPYETAAEGGGMVISVSKPIVASDTKEIVGVAAVDITYEDFSSFFRNSSAAYKSNSATDFTMLIDKNALVVVHDDVQTDLTFIGELEPGLTASMIEQGILKEQYTDIIPSNARFTNMAIETIYTEGGYTFEASITPSRCVGGSYKVTAVPNSNLFVIAVNNFEQKYTCPSVGLPPIRELVDTSDECSAVETVDENPSDVKSSTICPAFLVNKQILLDIYQKENSITSCPSVLDPDQEEEGPSWFSKLGITAVVSICAGFITIITTLILFRVRYKAAHTVIESSKTQQEKLDEIHKRLSERQKAGSAKNLTQLSMNSLQRKQIELQRAIEIQLERSGQSEKTSQNGSEAEKGEGGATTTVVPL
eukprot:CAMPEP_0118643710 /NCGR_PEP_ID=MMETSP0785-20121206/6537_1 /TAXON_ID=91992 /ORGANISM="Bolidomonas pacifica, Strain CCMP 1866" /LENGTH=1122 /DNA_ID=CAMNT_0006535393 /DNA_START=110 /DNA_END=3475 /DNA_ORIENTATION=+